VLRWKFQTDALLDFPQDAVINGTPRFSQGSTCCDGDSKMMLGLTFPKMLLSMELPDFVTTSDLSGFGASS